MKSEDSSDVLYALADAKDIATVRDVVRLVIHKLGGAEGFAESVAKDFEEAGKQPGNANKIRLDMALLGLMEKIGDTDDEEDNLEIAYAKAKALMREMNGDDPE